MTPITEHFGMLKIIASDKRIRVKTETYTCIVRPYEEYSLVLNDFCKDLKIKVLNK
jgi:hypothetical protein